MFQFFETRGGVAELGRATRTARAKASPEIGIQDQAQEGLGQRGGVARWDQAPAIVLDDLQRTAGCGGDDDNQWQGETIPLGSIFSTTSPLGVRSA